MRPGGYYYPRASAPFGGYGNGNGGGFRQAGGQQPYRPPPPPPEQRQMTLQQREAVLRAAGRLAAEYLVDRGDLPPDVLENRPPAPIPFQQQGLPAARFHQSRGPPQQQHRQALPGPFHFHSFQQRPHRRFAGPRPFQFHGGPGPFPKRPRQGPPRSFPYGPRAAAAPPHKTTAGRAGQGAVAAAAAPPVAAKSDVQEDEGSMAVDGDAGESQTTAQPGGATSGAPEQVNEPSSTSVGANDSESK